MQVMKNSRHLLQYSLTKVDDACTIMLWAQLTLAHCERYNFPQCRTYLTVSHP